MKKIIFMSILPFFQFMWVVYNKIRKGINLKLSKYYI